MTLYTRPIGEKDLQEVSRLQLVAYGPAFIEDDDILLDKITHGMASSFVLAYPKDDARLAGYCLSHNYVMGQVPALNRPLPPLTKQFTQHRYIHDLVLAPEVRGTGAVAQLLTQILDCAREQGCTSLALVAVQNSRGFWQRYGFKEDDCSADLSSYGKDARYMVRCL